MQKNARGICHPAIGPEINPSQGPSQSDSKSPSQSDPDSPEPEVWVGPACLHRTGMASIFGLSLEIEIVALRCQDRPVHIVRAPAQAQARAEFS
jgi:hypothetical protein